MVQICNYSSLIFAGNVTVLLIVSMTTDYWEYRGFNATLLNQTLFRANYTEFLKPVDTNSYIVMWYKRKSLRKPLDQYIKETLYEPPILANNYYHGEKNTSKNELMKSANIHEDLKAGMIVLFQQYGNLFRDCDALEDGVRFRLVLKERRESKCEYLSDRKRITTNTNQFKAVAHLERAAFAFALLCMSFMVIGLMTGGYGLLGRQKRVLTWASCCSLIAGILLTLSIALFHGKCHILRRTELLHGYRIPHKKTINESRTYSFGWSFILAWMCVFLCFISSYVWLYKAQDPSNSRRPGSRYVHRRRYKRTHASYVNESDYEEM